MVKMNTGWYAAINWEVCGWDYKYMVRSLGFGLLRADTGNSVYPSLCGPGGYIHRLLQEILFIRMWGFYGKMPFTPTHVAHSCTTDMSLG